MLRTRRQRCKVTRADHVSWTYVIPWADSLSDVGVQPRQERVLDRLVVDPVHDLALEAFEGVAANLEGAHALVDAREFEPYLFRLVHAHLEDGGLVGVALPLHEWRGSDADHLLLGAPMYCAFTS